MSEFECPQCGAPVAPGDTECRYCGEKIAPHATQQGANQNPQGMNQGNPGYNPGYQQVNPNNQGYGNQQGYQQAPQNYPPQGYQSNYQGNPQGYNQAPQNYNTGYQGAPQGYNQYQQPMYNNNYNIEPGINPAWPIKNKALAGILAIFFGTFGVHKFYLGKPGIGLLYIIFCCTGIPSILGIIEGIIYLTSNDHNFEVSNQVRTH